jgi:hypothetical protein
MRPDTVHRGFFLTLSPCHLVTLSLLLCPAIVRADGGTLRFSKQCDGYRITLFTAPTSLRAGPVDFSVLVQLADSDSPLPDLPVTVHVYPASEPQRRVGGPATTASATNKLFRAIQLDLPEPGRWHVEVVVHDPERPFQVDTELQVGPPPPSWIKLGIWIGWPAAAILLFAIHQCLVQRELKRRVRLQETRADREASQRGGTGGSPSVCGIT